MRRQLMSGVWVMLTTLCVIASLAAQTHPDFSGTWTVDTAKSDPLPPPPARGRGPASVPANQIVIRQTADDVTMVRGPRNLTYHFDGTETFHFDAGEVRSAVAWDGNRLVVSWKKEVFSPTEGKHDGLAQGEHQKQDRLHKNFLVLSSNF